MDGKANYWGNFPRKRRRNESPAAASVGEDGAAGGGLMLDDIKVKKVVNGGSTGRLEYLLAESKVVNYLSKLSGKFPGGKSSGERQTFIKMVVGLTEAEYFERELDKVTLELRESFGISGVSISDVVAGSIDRIVTLFGDVVSLARATAYVGYVVNAKLNCIVRGESFTLKSPNYSINLLVPNGGKESSLEQTLDKIAYSTGIRNMDFSNYMNYNLKSRFSMVYAKGDFTALFNFCLSLLDSSKDSFNSDYIDDETIHQLRIIHTSDNAKLHHKQSVNEGVLEKSLKDTLEFVYSKSRLSLIAPEHVEEQVVDS